MTESNLPKKRGRKPLKDGGTSTPRKIYIVCAGNVNNKLIFDVIYCPNTLNDTIDDLVIQEAKTIYKEKYGVDPEYHTKPMTIRNPVKDKNKPNEKISAAEILEQAKIVPDRKATAVYKDWYVSVRFLENYNDMAFIIYTKHTKDPAKKNKLQTGSVVYLNELENLEEVLA